MASLICGILILIAGSVKLLQTASDSANRPSVMRVGAQATVSGVVVSVVDVRLTETETLVDIAMQPVDSSVSEDDLRAGESAAPNGWVMLANGEISAPRSESRCATSTNIIRCTLVFVRAVGTPTVVYARNGEKAQWLGS